jgi:hypothetical protein
MKNLIAVLLLMTGAARAQEDLHKYDSQCLRLENLEESACTYGDGTGLLIGSDSTTHYTAKEWVRVLRESIERDKGTPGNLDNFERRWQGPVLPAATLPMPAPPPASAKAAAITDKKECKAAGLTWTHGACSLKDGQ